MDVKYSPKVFERYKREARKRNPCEYTEVMSGHVTDTCIEIVECFPVKHVVTMDSNHDPVQLRSE
jgi:hypothetical protein